MSADVYVLPGQPGTTYVYPSHLRPASGGGGGGAPARKSYRAVPRRAVPQKPVLQREIPKKPVLDDDEALALILIEWSRQ